MNATNGRDHLAHAFSVLLAGADVRVRPGHRRFRQEGAYVKDRPASPEDIVLFHLRAALASMPTSSCLDQRPRVPIIRDGKAIKELVG